MTRCRSPEVICEKGYFRFISPPEPTLHGRRTSYAVRETQVSTWFVGIKTDPGPNRPALITTTMIPGTTLPSLHASVHYAFLPNVRKHVACQAKDSALQVGACNLRRICAPPPFQLFPYSIAQSMRRRKSAKHSGTVRQAITQAAQPANEAMTTSHRRLQCISSLARTRYSAPRSLDRA